jgi:hypothetical protein
MAETGMKTVQAGIRTKRAELKRLREELEDLEDYLALLEARTRDDGKRHTIAEVRSRLKLS